MEEILRVQPTNLKVLIERGKIAAQRRDLAAVKDHTARFPKTRPEWNANTRKQLAAVETAADLPLPGEVPFEFNTLNNLLQAELGYNRDSIAVNPNTVGDSLQQFVRLSPLRTAPDPPDTGMTLTAGPPDGLAADVAKERWDVCVPVWLTGEGKPAIFVANATTARRADGPAPVLPFPQARGKPPQHTMESLPSIGITTGGAMLGWPEPTSPNSGIGTIFCWPGRRVEILATGQRRRVHRRYREDRP